MYSYTISKEADEKQFDRACKIVETQLEGYKKEKLLEDVDGTQIQIYRTNGKKTKVVNDYEVDAVYIDSEIELHINVIDSEKLKNKLLSLHNNVEYAKGVMTNAKEENWGKLLEILEEEKGLTSDRVALIALALGETKAF